MPYCMNCGAKYADASAICRKCWKDPETPHEQWESLLGFIKRNPEAEECYPDLSYHKEKLSLVVAILASALIIILVSTATLGLSLVVIMGSVVYMRINWLHSKASLMRVTPELYPNIFSMAQVAAGRLRIPMPPIFIKQTPIPNAFTTGFFDENWIVLHSGLLELLTNEELMSVIGHEMGHIKYRHVTLLMLTSPAQTGHAPMLATFLHPIFNNWHLKCEYTADRAGVVAVGEIEPCLMTEIKLLSGKTLEAGFDLEGYLKKLLNEEDSVSDRALELLTQTHPFARNRIKRMIEFSESDKYQRVLQNCMRPIMTKVDRT